MKPDRIHQDRGYGWPAIAAVAARLFVNPPLGLISRSVNKEKVGVIPSNTVRFALISVLSR